MNHRHLSQRSTASRIPAAGRGQQLRTWLVITALASGAWLALPQDDEVAAPPAAHGASPRGDSRDPTRVAADQSLGFIQPFGTAQPSAVLDSDDNNAVASPTRSEGEPLHSSDPDADRVADNDSTPDEELETSEAMDSSPAPAGGAQIPPEVELARTVARLNTASPSQQLELIDRIWAFGLDLHQEQSALAAIEPLTLAEDPLVAQRARDASENLSTALQTPAITETWAPDLAAETNAYVMELNVRATSDPDPLARRAAITELASHHHPSAVEALATAALDADSQNRAEVVASLLRLASSGYEEQRIIAMLETMAAQNTPEVAASAGDALQALR